MLFVLMCFANIAVVNNIENDIQYFNIWIVFVINTHFGTFSNSEELNYEFIPSSFFRTQNQNAFGYISTSKAQIKNLPKWAPPKKRKQTNNFSFIPIHNSYKPEIIGIIVPRLKKEKE